MAIGSRTDADVAAALDAVDNADSTPSEKAEMLMEIAMGLQIKPRLLSDIAAARDLYRKALTLVQPNEALLAARIRARLATALMTMTSGESAELDATRTEMETVLTTLVAEGTGAEIAEAEMNLGLILQNLAGLNRARITDAISAYQRALRTFDKQGFPKEFAILQNNLATAFMSIPFTPDSGKMREALAVRAFEEGLTVVTLIDHPVEYAMLQNNLGNALQYVSSSHRIENHFRAIEAYDQALKVRNRHDMPEEFANTIANKANCLANMPDDAETPEFGNPGNLIKAIDLLVEARQIFQDRESDDKAAKVARSSPNCAQNTPLAAPTAADRPGFQMAEDAEP